MPAQRTLNLTAAQQRAFDRALQGVIGELQRARDMHSPFRSLREAEAVFAKQSADLIRQLRISYHPQVPREASPAVFREGRQLAATALRFLIESPDIDGNP